MVLRRSVPAIVHTLGRVSQGLGRIGANGTMVIRMRVESKLLDMGVRWSQWSERARGRFIATRNVKFDGVECSSFAPPS